MTLCSSAIILASYSGVAAFDTDIGVTGSGIGEEKESSMG